MSLDELRTLVQNGELKEDVFKELVRINSASENVSSSASVVSSDSAPRTRSSPALVPTSLAAIIARPLSRALNSDVLHETVPAVAEGWVFARRPGKESWKRRYAILSYNRLEWYNTNDLKARKLKGEATLSGAITVKRLEDDVLSFALFQGDKQMFEIEFSADSEADVRRWVSELTRVLSLLNAASGKDLPVLLNRPTRSESQVTRDFRAREHAARQLEVSTAMATGGIMQEMDVGAEDRLDSSSPTSEEKQDDHNPEYNATAHLPQATGTHLEQVTASNEEVSQLKSEALAKIAFIQKDVEVKFQELDDLKGQFLDLHSKEPPLNAALSEARASESIAFEEVNRFRKEEKQITERISHLLDQESIAIKALEAFKAQHPHITSSSTSTQQTPSKTLQRLLMKDGIKVEIDPLAERLNELTSQMQSTRKSLHMERDKVKRVETERIKAEFTLKQARSHVAEVIRQQQDLVKSKRTLQERIATEQRNHDSLVENKTALEKAIMDLS